MPLDMLVVIATAVLREEMAHVGADPRHADRRVGVVHVPEDTRIRHGGRHEHHTHRYRVLLLLFAWRWFQPRLVLDDFTQHPPPTITTTTAAVRTVLLLGKPPRPQQQWWWRWRKDGKDGRGRGEYQRLRRRMDKRRRGQRHADEGRPGGRCGGVDDALLMLGGDEDGLRRSKDGRLKEKRHNDVLEKKKGRGHKGRKKRGQLWSFFFWTRNEAIVVWMIMAARMVVWKEREKRKKGRKTQR